VTIFKNAQAIFIASLLNQSALAQETTGSRLLQESMIRLTGLHNYETLPDTTDDNL
jgi:hypothetical protein